MARKYGPFDTSVFYEVENRRLQRAFNPKTGFVKTGQGAVTAGTGAQLVIAAYPDGALIDGMYVENPTSETVTLTTNTASTNPRIDRLVMRLDMTAKTIAPFQIVGTPASSPSAPSLTNTATVVDMPLCQYRFPGSASAQNPGSIVDERVYSTPASATISNGYGTDYGSGVSIATGAAQTGITSGYPALANLVLPRAARVTLASPAVRWNPSVQAVMFIYLNGTVVGKAVAGAGEVTCALIPTALDLAAGSYAVSARWEVTAGSLLLIHYGWHFLVADAL